MGREMRPEHQHDLQTLRRELSRLAEEAVRTTSDEISGEIQDHIQRLLEETGLLEEIEAAAAASGVG